MVYRFVIQPLQDSLGVPGHGTLVDHRNENRRPQTWSTYQGEKGLQALTHKNILERLLFSVCSYFSIDPFDFNPSNRKLELQLTSFRDRFRDR